MSRRLAIASSLPVAPVEQPRAKRLPRTDKSPRIHSLPDPDLEGLSPFDSAIYKKRAKALFAANLSILGSLRGELSNRDAAELLLGDRFKEGTIRGWKNPQDEMRYPRRAEIDRLDGLIQQALKERREGTFR